ncbi:MAG: ankyrin repeat domain-containing protein [Chthoniobacter sp.]|nr:ankyrin repeat domain-containing protein [Chthoniobacter sp.]
MKTSVDREGRTALHYAALENNGAEVKRLIEAGFAVDAPDKAGWTPLHFAAQEYSAAAAILLLEHGAPVDAQDSNGNTPLSRAVFNSKGRGELIRLLRKAGADPRRKNHYGVSPLSLVRTIGNYDVRQFFSDLPE